MYADVRYIDVIIFLRYPALPVPPLQLLPPSTIKENYIHDTGPNDDVPDAPGAGSHFPGGLYNDEGTTNWEMVRNAIILHGVYIYMYIYYICCEQLLGELLRCAA